MLPLIIELDFVGVQERKNVEKILLMLYQVRSCSIILRTVLREWEYCDSARSSSVYPYLESSMS